MHRIIIHFLFILFAMTALNGCKTAPVYNIEDAQFTTSNKISRSKVKQAILTASHNAGWQAKVLRTGKTLATYSTHNNKFSAAVIIDYDKDSYSIHYLKSSNLKYSQNTLDPQKQNTQNFFEKLIPGQDNAKPETIHKVYNSWVKKLAQNINHELSILHLSKTANQPLKSSHHHHHSATTLTSQQYKDRALRLKTKCANEPSTILSGTAIIKSSKANLRAGASTQCSIVGTLSNGDKVALLGQQGNWYYIQQSHEANAWIYHTLVNINASTSTSIPQTTTKHKHHKRVPPPPQPSKKISIAVIEFKTLNQEARDIALGDLVSESFTTALVNSNNFKIIEREQLDKVVHEMEMTQTGFIETTNAVEIGKMLHADAIITGSVALLNNQIQLNARIIEIESAYVISAESATTRYSLNNINQAIHTIVNNLSYKLMTSRPKK